MTTTWTTTLDPVETVTLPGGWHPEDWEQAWPLIRERLFGHVAGPEVTEPDQDPADDIEAEVPDVREDEVPE